MGRNTVTSISGHFCKPLPWNTGLLLYHPHHSRIALKLDMGEKSCPVSNSNWPWATGIGLWAALGSWGTLQIPGDEWDAPIWQSLSTPFPNIPQSQGGVSSSTGILAGEAHTVHDPTSPCWQQKAPPKLKSQGRCKTRSKPGFGEPPGRAGRGSTAPMAAPPCRSQKEWWKHGNLSQNNSWARQDWGIWFFSLF